MQTYCVRHGQVEVGFIEHEGHEFSAIGASVVGTDLTAYTKQGNGHITLTTWCGKIMLDCRCVIVQKFWSGSLAILFRLPNRRFIAGYALGEDGMLFRGELLTNTDEADARREVRRIANYFAELDADDELDE